MNNFSKIYIVCLFFFFASCASSKFKTTAVKSAEIVDLQYFDPVSFISYIEKGNRGRIDDSLSTKSKSLLIKATSQVKQIPISDRLIIEDPMTNDKLTREIVWMSQAAVRQKRTINLQLPPTLDSLLESKGKRFGLITFATGFTRRKGNFGGQVAKGVALGILTLGTYYQTPVKSNSIIYAMIADAQENNIAFFNLSVFSDHDPMDERVLQSQIQRLFEGYFLPSQANSDPMYQ